MPTAKERTAFQAALKKMICELFKLKGQLDSIDLTDFRSFFEGNELEKTIDLVARLVAEHSFDHYIVEKVNRSALGGDRLKLLGCQVFLGFLEVGHAASTGRPPRQYFAFGPRNGVVVS